MRRDSDIRRDVEDELRWDPDMTRPTSPSPSPRRRGANGFVRSYSQRTQAERDASASLGSWVSPTTSRSGCP